MATVTMKIFLVVLLVVQRSSGFTDLGDHHLGKGKERKMNALCHIA